MELPTKGLNIIVGSNDAGKSNYLRALNLFFNNESHPGVEFDFWKNYSNQRHGVRREENRIEIELVIAPPKKQYFKNNGDVKWTKIWRENSLLPDEEIVHTDGSEFTSNFKSSYYKWLKKIRFKYVPAIKSQEYFNQLMFDLYDVLQKDTNSLEQEFNRQIGDKTSQISHQISERLNLESVLQFKGTFRDLFNTLEFGSTDGKIMLSQRGDGIKVRHIPVILQNMAEAELREERKREPIANTIWGFEEPENNLEFDSAKKLADHFVEYLDNIHFQDEQFSKYDEGVQIFLSTHSPIFYTLGNNSNEKVSTFFVSKSKDESSNIRLVDHQQSIQLEKEMKLLPLIELSKHWKNINDEIDSIRKDKDELEKAKEQFSNNKKCIILTEDKKQGLVETLLLANGFVIDEFDLVSYNGCSKIGSAEVLYNYLKDKFRETCPPILIHRDKDYMNPRDIQEEKKKYLKKGLELFITEGTDVESYFTRIDHIKHCHPELSEDEILEIRKKALQDNREQAIQAIKRIEYGDKYADKNSFLMDKIPEYYDENEAVLFHGKKVFRNIKSKKKKKTGN
ncbi:MAG: hypothetical protein KDC92_10750, partial [Bacteroidetes bacterium]|nr:hypothetical protein [Bacteroidota bacterium]